VKSVKGMKRVKRRATHASPVQRWRVEGRARHIEPVRSDLSTLRGLGGHAGQPLQRARNSVPLPAVMERGPPQERATCMSPVQDARANSVAPSGLKLCGGMGTGSLRPRPNTDAPSGLVDPVSESEVTTIIHLAGSVAATHRSTPLGS
jgi:hypothetical protein